MTLMDDSIMSAVMSNPAHRDVAEQANETAEVVDETAVEQAPEVAPIIPVATPRPAAPVNPDGDAPRPAPSGGGLPRTDPDDEKPWHYNAGDIFKLING